MAYGAPPGTASSLPARPPASGSNRGFKPAFGAASQAPAQPYTTAAQYQPGATSYAGGGGSSSSQYGGESSSNYGSRNQYGAAPTQYVAASQYVASSYSSYPGGAPAGTAPGVSSSSQAYSYPGQEQQRSGPQNAGYGAPQIQNPFPLPGVGGNSYETSEAAQIAEWQSAYSAAPQLGKDGKPIVATEFPKPEIPAVAANPDKKKTVARQGGGKKWTDDSLLEWDPAHLRLFVGNLAGETTDESLLKAFSRWKSVQKARVVRDKRSTKSKGYGFVSFSDADDFFQAAKEMNGKYIQSHPVVVKKANTEIKVTNVREKGKYGKHNKKPGGSNQHGGGSGGAGGYEPSLGPIGGAGVTKPGQKTKNGLKLLG
ncbi:putative RNA-binding protein [Tolypocladium ophioglossoides CBS 100239]|uniref:Putative RNA-binding protein n=1 Tax=Tolypocladium ophioglossoides (strain CBS 100239) TaxID=1163406 RepID=A0A0L0N7S5_TOLOC|nr:putative RNA-binding protein [Tolypocladium ophioglossoides CBS 100239]